MQLQAFADGAIAQILQQTARSSSLHAGQNSICERVQLMALSPLPPQWVKEKQKIAHELLPSCIHTMYIYILSITHEDFQGSTGLSC